ncbi:MAG TPA: hypothetical protein VFC39_12910 [Acidobacteriaceae bacterium]|nr:hypothetical protein [Acidobacteriaceae bacterium]
METIGEYSDDDFRQTMLRTLRLLAVVTLIAAPVVWWKLGWHTALLLAIGAAISGSGLWEWLRLMTAVMVRMDAGGTPRPTGLVLGGFMLRLGLTLAVLYVSLRFLNGSVYALAAGLALGVFALGFEGLKLVKAWTV